MPGFTTCRGGRAALLVLVLSCWPGGTPVRAHDEGPEAVNDSLPMLKFAAMAGPAKPLATEAFGPGANVTVESSNTKHYVRIDGPAGGQLTTDYSFPIQLDFANV